MEFLSKVNVYACRIVSRIIALKNIKLQDRAEFGNISEIQSTVSMANWLGKTCIILRQLPSFPMRTNTAGGWKGRG